MGQQRCASHSAAFSTVELAAKRTLKIILKVVIIISISILCACALLLACCWFGRWWIIKANNVVCALCPRCGENWLKLSSYRCQQFYNELLFHNSVFLNYSSRVSSVYCFRHWEMHVGWLQNYGAPWHSPTQKFYVTCYIQIDFLKLHIAKENFLICILKQLMRSNKL